MNIKETNCAGVKIIECFSNGDSRGLFTKVYNDPDYQAAGLDVYIKETYYSVSNKNVIRGMHFQLPPYDHAKIVHVIYGAVEDVILDLRKESATYKQAFAFELSGDKPAALYIPKGFAHGFKCKADNTMMLYQVTSAYQKESDTGVLYSSIDYDWKLSNPIVSERDKTFIELDNFSSPF